MARSTINQWQMFKAVVEHGGFNQASSHVHKSPSSLHHAVQKLEEQLGVSLFTTQGRRLELTTAGEQLLRRIDYLLAEVDRMEQVASNMQQGVESRLRVAVDEAFPRELLYQALANVAEEFPLIRFEILETILSGADELLNEGKADVSLSPFTLSGNLSEDLCAVEFVAVAGASHWLSQATSPLKLEDLKACRQIVLRDSAQRNVKDYGWLGAEQRWTVSHMATSIELIRRGLGFAWLPRHSVAAYLLDGSLAELKLERGATRTTNFYLNFTDAAALGPVTRSFLGHIRFLTL
ncbi:MAG: LysR family transcriptional regulator [Gammaproteobacteria bacterium]|nr:LysR family transcriptional regulator [Gammaproteobacteria bacterium]